MKVAIGDWFARERVGAVIWRLWEPFADPFARCNIWFVAGRDRGLKRKSASCGSSAAHA